MWQGIKTLHFYGDHESKFNQKLWWDNFDQLWYLSLTKNYPLVINTGLEKNLESHGTLRVGLEHERYWILESEMIDMDHLSKCRTIYLLFISEFAQNVCTCISIFYTVTLQKINNLENTFRKGPLLIFTWTLKKSQKWEGKAMLFDMCWSKSGTNNIPKIASEIAMKRTVTVEMPLKVSCATIKKLPICADKMWCKWAFWKFHRRYSTKMSNFIGGFKQSCAQLKVLTISIGAGFLEICLLFKGENQHK